MPTIHKDDGGLAFPRSPHSGECSDDGMTLRDYFAARAMQADMATWETAYKAERIASIAYEIADAMIAERAK